MVVSQQTPIRADNRFMHVLMEQLLSHGSGRHLVKEMKVEVKYLMFCTNTASGWRINHLDFVDPLTFPLLPTLHSCFSLILLLLEGLL